MLHEYSLITMAPVGKAWNGRFFEKRVIINYFQPVTILLHCFTNPSSRPVSFLVKLPVECFSCYSNIQKCILELPSVLNLLIYPIILLKSIIPIHTYIDLNNYIDIFLDFVYRYVINMQYNLFMGEKKNSFW